MFARAACAVCAAACVVALEDAPPQPARAADAIPSQMAVRTKALDLGHTRDLSAAVISPSSRLLCPEIVGERSYYNRLSVIDTSEARCALSDHVPAPGAEAIPTPLRS